MNIQIVNMSILNIEKKSNTEAVAYWRNIRLKVILTDLFHQPETVTSIVYRNKSGHWFYQARSYEVDAKVKSYIFLLSLK